METTRSSALLALLLPLAACGDYSNLPLELLSRYRAALPQEHDVIAAEPAAKAKADLGETAEFPRWGVAVARAVNSISLSVVQLLQAVVGQPPASYTPQTREFLWGPYPIEDTAMPDDRAYVYVRDLGAESQPFRYWFAFLRTRGDDLATAVSPIWGAASVLDGDSLGRSGLLVYDFEASRAWSAVHDPGHGPLERGRFALLYASQALDALTSVRWVVGVFRGFLPADAATDQEPLDLEYLWGSLRDGEQRLDFLDFDLQVDLEETASASPEDVLLTIAFFNSGVGRAELVAAGGDIELQHPGWLMTGSECWDESLARVYLELGLRSEDGASELPWVVQGTPASCAFDSLAGIPRLEDLERDDPQLLATLRAVAETGQLE